MKSAAAKRQYPIYDPVHLIGTVTCREEDDSFAVDCDGHDWHARQAASCLLAPQPGDQVLISGPDAARVYLIAVIEQAAQRSATLETVGDMVLRSRSGSVALEGAQAVRLAGQQAVSIDTASLKVQAKDAHCVPGQMKFLGADITAPLGPTGRVGKGYEAGMDRPPWTGRA